MVIRTLDQPVNYRDDSIDPTSTTGFPLLADETLIYDGTPAGVEALRLIRASSATGDADVRIAYYGT